MSQKWHKSEEGSSVFSDIDSTSRDSHPSHLSAQHKQNSRQLGSPHNETIHEFGSHIHPTVQKFIHHPSAYRTNNESNTPGYTSNIANGNFNGNNLLGASRVQLRSRPLSSPTSSPPRSAKYTPRLSEGGGRPWSRPRPKSWNGHSIDAAGNTDPPRPVSSVAIRQKSASPRKKSILSSVKSVTASSQKQKQPEATTGWSNPVFSSSWLQNFTSFGVQNAFPTSTTQKNHAETEEKKPFIGKSISSSPTKLSDNPRSSRPHESTEDNQPRQSQPQPQRPFTPKSSNHNPFSSPTKSPTSSSSLRNRRKNNHQQQQHIQDPLSLHNLISCASTPSDPRWLQALELLSSSPDPHFLASQTIESSTPSNWTALHIASLSNPPLFIIYGLLLVNPEGARVRDSGGRLPLHLAAGVGAGVGVLSALARFYGEGVVSKEGRGLIPLHLALSRGGKRLVFGSTVERGEEATSDDDEEEDRGVSLEMLRILLGQRMYTSISGTGNKVEDRRQSVGKRVRDGDMRKGNHLNFGVGEIEEGMFGDNPNSITEKERKRRERERQIQYEEVNEATSDWWMTSDSREDGNPLRDEFLASLWKEEGSYSNLGSSSKFRMFGNAEIEEADTFSEGVKNCLRRLEQWRRRQGMRGGFNCTFSEEEEQEEGEWKKLNPAAIPAPPHMRLPIHMAIRMNHQCNNQQRRIDRISDPQASPPSAALNTLPTNQNEILRILIHAHPRSLVQQDLQGRTPLMTCLQLAHHPAAHPIDLEMTELLLGIRTAGFQSTPEWLDDIDLVSVHHRFQRRNHHTHPFETNCNNEGIAASLMMKFDKNIGPYNPAVIPINQSLPLHIAAQESLSSSIVRAIYSSYPGARYVQNEKRCTPLHCALRNITGSKILDLEVIQLLMDERVVRMNDDLNQSVLDLLVINAKHGRISPHIDRSDSWKDLPLSCNGIGFGQPITRRRSNQIYQMVFQYYLAGSSTPSPSTVDLEDTFLYKLRVLPPWLRRLACFTPSVQEIMLKELVKPGFTALVMLYGIVLMVLIVFFTLLVDKHVSTYFRSGNSNKDIGENMGTYKIGIVIAWVYLTVYEICFFATCFRLHVVSSQYFGNIWSWVTVAGLVSTAVTTVKLHQNQFEDIHFGSSVIVSIDDSNTFRWITAAIGLLWAMLVGYIARWWYGVNVFCSGVIEMARGLIPALMVFVIFIASFMQILYLIDHQTFGRDERCLYDVDTLRDERLVVCSIWDIFKVTFSLIVGESFFAKEIGAEIQKSVLSVVLLVCISATLAFLFLLQMVSVSMKTAASRRTEETIVDTFWAPILTFIFFVHDTKEICCNSTQVPKPVTIHQSREIQLETIWEYLVSSLAFNANLTDTKCWYIQGDRCASIIFTNKWIVRLFALFILPAWLSTGLITLGMAWPPQVRWWIFSSTLRTHNNIFDEDTGQKKSLDQGSSELSRLKAMIYERFHNVQDDLQTIRHLISH